jgi:SAM-dependent methyltransferase
MNEPFRIRWMRPVLNLGCGDQALGDLRVDFVPGAANVIANIGTSLPIKDQEVGTVYSRFFIEHLPNVNVLLAEAYRILKPGGQLVLITDNAAYPIWHLTAKSDLGQVHRPGGYKGNSPEDRHYSLFTDAHLHNHLELVGFVKRDVAYVDAEQAGLPGPPPPLQRLQRMLRRASPSIGSITEPYLSPHLAALGEKPPG